MQVFLTNKTNVLVCLAILSLLIGIVVSAVMVVSVSHSSRMHFGGLELLSKRAVSLQSQASRLTLELSTLASFGRIEKEAMAHLSMRRVRPGEMVVVQ